MSLETQLFAALKPLAGNRVWRAVADPKVTALPRITFQQVGGNSLNFVDSQTLPGASGPRVQINVWHSRYDDAKALMKTVENTLRAVTALHTYVHGEAVIGHEDATGLFGARQDFSFWCAD